MLKVTKREAAKRDLVEHFVYLAENAGLDVAERFLTHAEASFGDLARVCQIPTQFGRIRPNSARKLLILLGCD